MVLALIGQRWYSEEVGDDGGQDLKLVYDLAWASSHYAHLAVERATPTQQAAESPPPRAPRGPGDGKVLDLLDELARRVERDSGNAGPGGAA